MESCFYTKALAWFRGIDRSGSNVSLTWWMKSSPHCFYLTFCFPFWVFIWDAGGCWYSLSRGSVSVWFVRPAWPQKVVLHFSTAAEKKQWENGDWHHPEYQMMRMENHAVDDPEEIDHVLNVFSGSFLRCVCLCVWSKKVLGIDSKWKTVLYCIFIAFFFVLHFIVNWIYSEKIILC